MLYVIIAITLGIKPNPKPFCTFKGLLKIFKGLNLKSFSYLSRMQLGIFQKKNLGGHPMPPCWSFVGFFSTCCSLAMDTGANGSETISVWQVTKKM